MRKWVPDDLHILCVQYVIILVDTYLYTYSWYRPTYLAASCDRSFLVSRLATYDSQAPSSVKCRASRTGSSLCLHRLVCASTSTCRSGQSRKSHMCSDIGIIHSLCPYWLHHFNIYSSQRSQIPHSELITHSYHDQQECFHGQGSEADP